MLSVNNSFLVSIIGIWYSSSNKNISPFSCQERQNINLEYLIFTMTLFYVVIWLINPFFNLAPNCNLRAALIVQNLACPKNIL